MRKIRCFVAIFGESSDVIGIRVAKVEGQYTQEATAFDGRRGVFS